MKIKTIIASVGTVIALVAILVAALWVSHVPDDTVCQQVKILLCDSVDNQFVTESELHRTLQRSGLSPVGKCMDEVSCQAIEDCLLRHEMIRTAECYKVSTGEVCVRVTQRVPMLYVMSAEGNYYVDTDRKVMPVRSTIQVQVPIFRGNISKQSATQEYYDFVAWLMDDHYWKNRITHVHVRNPKSIVLAQREVEGDILLGALEGYEQKMARLRKLYVKGFDKIGYKPYKEYDLRFDGQVIGRN